MRLRGFSWFFCEIKVCAVGVNENHEVIFDYYLCG